MERSLVAYFSATGTTKRAAEALARKTGADLFEIIPENPYSPKDLDWHDGSSRSSIEMNDLDCRPEIASRLDSLEPYETIYLGFPVWWYVEPRIIDTFLESYDFSRKTIIPFATSGGSGLGKAPQHMAKLCPDATVQAGGLLNNLSDSAIEQIIAASE